MSFSWMDDQTLFMLHLSDFHVGKDGHGQKVLFAELLSEIKASVDEAGRQPDLIMITGDIANKGIEYAPFVRDFLEPLRSLMPGSRIFMVPGNHDVNRKKAILAHRYDMLDVCPNFFDPTEKGLEERESLFPRFLGYVNALRRFTPCDWLTSEAGTYTQVIQLRGFRVGILLLNTAWLSGSDGEKGRLQLSPDMVMHGLRQLDDTQIVLVLGHHPLSWLQEADQKRLSALLGKRNALYFSGHVYKGQGKRYEGAGEGFWAFGAGAAFHAREHPLWVNGFQWYALAPTLGELHVHPRNWNADHLEWVTDTTFPNKHKSQRPGWWHFKLQAPQIALKQGLPPIHRMPLHPNPHFVGREEVMSFLATSLMIHRDTTIAGTFALKGMSGIGKTQLAVQYAYSQGQHYPGGVFWLNFDKPNTIPAEVAACGPPLGLFSFTDNLPEAEMVRQVRKVWDRSGPPCLIVFDNCEDPKLWEAWRPKGTSHHVLITSRRQTWSGITQVSLDTLTRSESVTLLLALARHLRSEDANRIAEALGDLPLALHLAGSYLHRYRSRINADRFLNDLQEKGLEHSSMTGSTSLPTQHEPHLMNAFCLSIDSLNEETDALVLRLLAHTLWFASGEPIPQQILLDTLNTDDESAIDALTVALDLGLLYPETDSLTIHRLVRDALYNYLPQDAVQTAETTVGQWLQEVAGDLFGNRDYIPAMTRLAPHLRFLVDHWFHQETALTAGLCNTLATYLEEVNADFVEAETYARRALAVGETVFGVESSETAVYLNNLAQLLKTTGRLDEAEPLMRRALTINEDSFGPDHPHVAVQLNNLALLLNDTGRLEEVEPLMYRALMIEEAAFGPDHPHVAVQLNNLALLLQETGRLDEAEPLMRRALNINEISFGRDHPAVAIRLNNLSRLLQNTGRLEEAELLMRRALTICQNTLPESHPNVMLVQNNLKQLLQEIGGLKAHQALTLPLSQGRKLESARSIESTNSLKPEKHIEQPGTTYALTEFLFYLVAYGGGSSQLLVEPDESIFRAAIEQNLQDGEETGALFKRLSENGDYKPDPLWKAWLENYHAETFKVLERAL